MATAKKKTKKTRARKTRTAKKPVRKAVRRTTRKTPVRKTRRTTAARKPARKPARRTVRKPATRKTARKPAARKPARKTTARRTGSKVVVRKVPARSERYVVVDGSMLYQGSSRLLSAARKKQAALQAKHPKKVFRIVDTKG
jgi:hypothetical protein